MPKPKPWYSLKRAPARAEAGEQSGDSSESSAELLIYGDIGYSWWEESITAADLVKELQALADVDVITVRINSFGGSVPDGLAIFNALKRHPAKIITTNDGTAMSIASLIYMAGDERHAAENSLLMIHAPWTYSAGNAVQLREQADLLDKWAEAMAKSYAASGQTSDDCLALLTDGIDHYYTADEALSEGFATAVTDAIAPAVTAALRAMAQNRFQAGASAPRQNPAAAAAHTSPENTMPNPAPAAPAPVATPKTEDQIRAQALADDKARREAIAAAAAPFAGRDGMSDLVARLQADTNVSAESANRQILAALAQGAEPAAGGHVVRVEDTGRANRIAAQADALLVRAGVANEETRKRVRAERNPYRADSLLDLARASLDRAGFKHAGMDKMAIVSAAFTQGTSDFPVLLENVMHKALEAGYAVAPLTWTRFAKRGSVSDFRAHNRYRIGSLGNLDRVNELGEFQNKTIPNGEKASIAADTKGNIINISRQVIINDDLGAFIGLADMMGRAAARTIEADVYALLAMNAGLGPVLADGKTLFHADHGNVGQGAALSVDSLDADRVLMRSQKDVSGHDFLDILPTVLLVALGQGGNARVIVDAEYDPDTANKLQRPNKVRGIVGDIVDSPRLNGTRRYMFADPNTAPVIEVAFLDGNETPFLEVEQGFDVDGSRHKVRLDYGVAGVDFRGAVTNAGA
ncbi:MAG: Clp protease ClpP [Candidatus Dactylopiibacterium sp.]|nr:Clp protease ClpP [Candidatus Dactylopiibacterium sp.]